LAQPFGKIIAGPVRGEKFSPRGARWRRSTPRRWPVMSVVTTRARTSSNCWSTGNRCRDWWSTKGANRSSKRLPTVICRRTRRLAPASPPRATAPEARRGPDSIRYPISEFHLWNKRLRDRAPLGTPGNARNRAKKYRGGGNQPPPRLLHVHAMSTDFRSQRFGSGLSIQLPVFH